MLCLFTGLFLACAICVRAGLSTTEKTLRTFGLRLFDNATTQDILRHVVPDVLVLVVSAVLLAGMRTKRSAEDDAAHVPLAQDDQALSLSLAVADPEASPPNASAHEAGRHRRGKSPGTAETAEDRFMHSAHGHEQHGKQSRNATKTQQLSASTTTATSTPVRQRQQGSPAKAARLSTSLPSRAHLHAAAVSAALDATGSTVASSSVAGGGCGQLDAQQLLQGVVGNTMCADFATQHPRYTLLVLVPLVVASANVLPSAIGAVEMLLCFALTATTGTRTVRLPPWLSCARHRLFVALTTVVGVHVLLCHLAQVGCGGQEEVWGGE